MLWWDLCKIKCKTSTNYVVNISIMWNKNDKKSVQLPFFRFGCKVGKKKTFLWIQRKMIIHKGFLFGEHMVGCSVVQICPFLLKICPKISLQYQKQPHPHLQMWNWALNNTWRVVHTWRRATQNITGRGKYFITLLFGICIRMYSFPLKINRAEIVATWQEVQWIMYCKWSVMQYMVMSSSYLNKVDIICNHFFQDVINHINQ